MVLVYIGAGGALGSICRYLMGLVPVSSDFPVMTLLTNFFGALLIGAVSEVSLRFSTDRGALHFMKTGFCGGFTTFSTFSLETVSLLERGRFVAGGAYAALSFSMCICGVMAGRMAVKTILR